MQGWDICEGKPSKSQTPLGGMLFFLFPFLFRISSEAAMSTYFEWLLFNYIVWSLELSYGSHGWIISDLYPGWRTLILFLGCTGEAEPNSKSNKMPEYCRCPFIPISSPAHLSEMTPHAAPPKAAWGTLLRVNSDDNLNFNLKPLIIESGGRKWGRGGN